jgi:formamidopyrimidine-DNA glycosylase
VRHLRPLLQGKVIRACSVFRPRVIRPTSIQLLKRSLKGGRFTGLERRGKYLLFHLQPPSKRPPLILLGHLGMTGRMYLLPAKAQLPKHASVALNLGRENFVFEDTRYFGRFTLDTTILEHLGPEPLNGELSAASLGAALARSSQAIKVKLLDQTVVAGLGNIYASEALFRAGISPKIKAGKLSASRVERLCHAIRDVLSKAIACGSTVPLNYSGRREALELPEKADVLATDGFFYFGRAPGTPDFYAERLLVYDRAELPCVKCGSLIRKLVQAARSTYYCPTCQTA